MKSITGTLTIPHKLFVKDLDTGEIKQIAEELYGTYQISGDGKSVIYMSGNAQDLITHKNLETGVTQTFDGWIDQGSKTNNISLTGTLFSLQIIKINYSQKILIQVY